MTSLFFGGFALAVLFAGWAQPDVNLQSRLQPSLQSHLHSSPLSAAKMIVVQPVVRRIHVKAAHAARVCSKNTLANPKSHQVCATKTKFHLDHVVSSEVEN